MNAGSLRESALGDSRSAIHRGRLTWHDLCWEQMHLFDDVEARGWWILLDVMQRVQARKRREGPCD